MNPQDIRLSTPLNQTKGLQTRITLSEMQLSDIEAVTQLDRRCYALPWSPAAYITEVGNPSAYYIIAKNTADILIGYAGMWVIMDEIHMTTIAVDPSYRGLKIGELLLLDILEEGLRRGAARATLEVREHNSVAHNLYLKYGFSDVAQRKNYYSDNAENAIIMWANDMTSEDYQRLLRKLKHDIMQVVEIVSSTAQASE